MPPKAKRAPKRYSADQMAKLRYTIRKPETPAKEKESLFGKRLVTYDQIRRKQKERRHRTAITEGSDAEGPAEVGGMGVGHGNSGRGGAVMVAVAVSVVHDREVVPRLLIDVVRALREIRHYQKSTAMLIQLLPFSRLVRDIVRDCVPRGVEMRWSRPAMACLQTVVEEAMVLLFELTYAPNSSFHTDLATMLLFTQSVSRSCQRTCN